MRLKVQGFGQKGKAKGSKVSRGKIHLLDLFRLLAPGLCLKVKGYWLGVTGKRLKVPGSFLPLSGLSSLFFFMIVPLPYSRPAVFVVFVGIGW